MWYGRSCTRHKSLIGETLLRLAQHAHDPALMVIAQYAPGATRFYLARYRLPASTWRKVSPFIRQSSAVRWCSALAKTQVLPVEPLPLRPSGCWATRRKPWPASTRPWRYAHAVASL